MPASAMSIRTAPVVFKGKWDSTRLHKHVAATLITLIICACLGVFSRLRVYGIGNIQKRGGFVLVCNHVSCLDVVLLTLLCLRPVRVLGYDGLRRRWISHWLFRIF